MTAHRVALFGIKPDQRAALFGIKPDQRVALFGIKSDQRVALFGITTGRCSHLINDRRRWQSLVVTARCSYALKVTTR